MSAPVQGLNNVLLSLDIIEIEDFKTHEGLPEIRFWFSYTNVWDESDDWALCECGDRWYLRDARGMIMSDEHDRSHFPDADACFKAMQARMVGM